MMCEQLRFPTLLNEKLELVLMRGERTRDIGDLAVCLVLDTSSAAN